MGIDHFTIFDADGSLSGPLERYRAKTQIPMEVGCGGWGTTSLAAQNSFIWLQTCVAPDVMGWFSTGYTSLPKSHENSSIPGPKNLEWFAILELKTIQAVVAKQTCHFLSATFPRLTVLLRGPLAKALWRGARTKPPGCRGRVAAAKMDDVGSTVSWFPPMPRWPATRANLNRWVTSRLNWVAVGLCVRLCLGSHQRKTGKVLMRLEMMNMYGARAENLPNNPSKMGWLPGLIHNHHPKHSQWDSSLGSWNSRISYCDCVFSNEYD